MKVLPSTSGGANAGHTEISDDSGWKDCRRDETACEADSATPATEGARSGYHWITGEQARAHVHQLRHQSDAILAGVGR